MSLSGLGANSRCPNRLGVFAVIASNVVHRWYDPNNLSPDSSTVAGRPNEPYWEALDAPPGGAAGSPAAATWGTNRLDIFVVAQNMRQIYCINFFKATDGLIGCHIE